MDPVTWVINAKDLILGLMVPGGIAIILAGIGMWGAAKPLDSPKLSSSGVKAVVGGAVMTAAPAVLGMVQAVAARVTGGGGA
jgi:hypothetical protein